MQAAAIYARVSSDKQREEQTIASQTAAAKAFAVNAELEVPLEWVFEDEGYSGATLVRPALEHLRDLVAQGLVEVVVCYAPDRLARKYAYQVLLLEEFARGGAEVRFVRGRQAETPEDELLLQFQGMIAEYEKAQIIERTRRGKLHRARSGMVNVLSGAPYGYRYVRKTPDTEARYEVIEDQAVVVQSIFERYTTEWLSIGELARWLTRRGIPTATGKHLWDRSVVWAILRNPAYCGQAAFGKTGQIDTPPRLNRITRRHGYRVSHNPAHRERPRQAWVTIPVPAIISERTFELAQRRLQDNARFAARRTIRPSLLQGLLVCESCGYAYYGSSGGRTARPVYYYRCLGSDDWRYEHGRVCRNLPVRQDHLDAVVWDHVARLLSDPALVRRELDRRLAELQAADPGVAQKARLERELRRLSAARGRLIEAYQESLLSLDELRQRMPVLATKESTVRTQLDAIEARLISQASYVKLAETLQSFAGRLQHATNTASIIERQQVLRLIIKQIVVGSERVLIRHSLPVSDPDPPPGYRLRWGSPLAAPGEHRSIRTRRPLRARVADQTRYTGRREYLHLTGRPTYRLIRYADDFVLVVKGTRAHAEALRVEIGQVLTNQLRLKLSPTKTLVTHIDDGFTFLGFRIQRQVYKGRRRVYTFPSPEAFQAVKRKVKALTRHTHTSVPLKQLLYRLNPLLRGWANYFRHAGSKRTFAYLDHLTWWRVARWLWKKHKRPSWKRLRRRELRNWEIGEDGIQLFRPHRIPIVRYRYRGTRIPSPWGAAPRPVEAIP